MGIREQLNDRSIVNGITRGQWKSFIWALLVCSYVREFFRSQEPRIQIGARLEVVLHRQPKHGGHCSSGNGFDRLKGHVEPFVSISLTVSQSRFIWPLRSPLKPLQTTACYLTNPSGQNRHYYRALYQVHANTTWTLMR